MPVGGAAILLGAFAAAGYAVAVATRPAVRADPRGSDALFLGGVLVLCLNAAGEAARQIGLGAPVRCWPRQAWRCSARSAWPARRGAARVASAETQPRASPPNRDCGWCPAVAAAGAIVRPVVGRAGRPRHARRLLRHHHAVRPDRRPAAADAGRKSPARCSASSARACSKRSCATSAAPWSRRWIARTRSSWCAARPSSRWRADSVLLWMLDPSTDELEAVEVLSAKRESLLRRRLTLEDPTSLAVRVARTGAAEIVSGVPSASASNAFLNVLLHAQALLAVPVVHGGRVQGVLVCVDARNPAAYAPARAGQGRAAGVAGRGRPRQRLPARAAAPPTRRAQRAVRVRPVWRTRRCRASRSCASCCRS